MKKIVAIIRPEKLSDVKSALEEVGCTGMTVSDVRGYGRQKGITQQWRGEEYQIDFLPKVRLVVVVPDGQETAVANAIIKVAKTDHVGDGKIFISTVDEVIRVRTGETGDDAV